MIGHPTAEMTLRLMLERPADIVLVSCSQGFHRRLGLDEFVIDGKLLNPYQMLILWVDRLD